MRDADVSAIAHADTAAVESSDFGDDAFFDEAVLRLLEGDGAAVAAGEGEAADGDVFRAFDFEEGVGSRQPNLTLIDGLDRPEIKHAAVLVVEPLAGCIQLFEGVLKVVAVVRMEVVATVFLQREHPRLRIKRQHGLDEVPPAVLGKDVELHVLGVRPFPHVLRLYEQRAFPKMAFGSTGRRKRRDEGPAAVEWVLGVEVRITGEDLAFAVAEQLFRQEALRQQLGDIGFDDLALVLFPAGDFGAADERALRAGKGKI